MDQGEPGNGGGPVASADHQPVLELDGGLPEEIEAATSAEARVRARCPSGCDLAGARVELFHDGRLVTAGALSPSEGGEASTTNLTVRAPARVGEATWELVLPAQEVAGVPHDERRLAATAMVVPHITSLAIWDVPSPVLGSPFVVRVGVRCSAGCRLAGQSVEVLDSSGVSVGEGRLSDEPSPGTTALYESEVSLVAPDRTGVFARSVRFARAGAEPPHLPATATFTFRAVEPPDHSVVVRVTPRDVARAPEGIEVRLGPYRAYTDDRGAATVKVPKGTFELTLWRIDLEPVSKRVEVTGEMTMAIEAGPRRVVDEDAERYG